MMSNPVIINFEKRGYEGKVFTGRRRGELARSDFCIDDLDSIQTKVEVIIPSGLFSLTSSFFLGMFGPTLNKLGSKREFREKYRIIGPAPILEEIDEYIDTELRRPQFMRAQ